MPANAGIGEFSVPRSWDQCRMLRLAILDDYARVALTLAEWSRVAARCRIDVIDRPLGVPDEAAGVLAPYHVVCHLRERTAMPRALIERLGNLKLITITGHIARSIWRRRGSTGSSSAIRRGGRARGRGRARRNSRLG